MYKTTTPRFQASPYLRVIYQHTPARKKLPFATPNQAFRYIMAGGYVSSQLPFPLLPFARLSFYLTAPELPPGQHLPELQAMQCPPVHTHLKTAEALSILSLSPPLSLLSHPSLCSSFTDTEHNKQMEHPNWPRSRRGYERWRVGL